MNLSHKPYTFIYPCMATARTQLWSRGSSWCHNYTAGARVN